MPVKRFFKLIRRSMIDGHGIVHITGIIHKDGRDMFGTWCGYAAVKRPTYFVHDQEPSCLVCIAGYS